MKKLKARLNAKLSKNGGFTLIEMLIVVAIIAILVVVSIPLVTNALDSAKHATDSANERAAKAEILICYLADGTTSITKGKAYYYDAAKGKLQDTSVSAGYGKHGDHDNNMIIAVQVNASEEVDIQWVEAGQTAGTTWNTGLCSGNDVNH